ncbi:MAG: hypothetical protein H2056_07945 [Sphingopyxis sp.]|nr:hypothetical protein [Sphingopyxis sp.]
MNRISISQAWAYATSFFSDQHSNHAVVIIGIGVVVPTVLQILLGGGAAALDPAALASGANAFAALGATAFLLGLIAFVLQTGSYFASWRMGLMPGQESIGSAISYGMVAALPVILVFIGFILVFGIVFGVLFGGAMIPALIGGDASAAGAAGAAGMVLLALPLIVAFGLWLSARFCVMGPIMAAGRSYNPLPALAESWRMTAASQWKLMGYFLLLIIVAMVLGVVLSLVFGVSLLAGGGAGAGSVVLLTIMSALIGIPIAYLYVGIPVGIYKALGGDNASDIFA